MPNNFFSKNSKHLVKLNTEGVINVTLFFKQFATN